jgi:poly-gamma-glutamate synthesis protein (capsule biosynthesis protein)
MTTLAFLGDLMLGGDIGGALEEHDPSWLFGDCLDHLRRADAVIANLEGPITTSEARWRRTFKFYHFKAHPNAVKLLQAGNVRAVCLANNHMLDYGERGLQDTLAALRGAAITAVGAGRDLAEASAGRILDIAGVQVGLVAATDGMPEFAATAESAGTHVLEFRGGNLDWIARSVSDLKRAGASLIVLSVHWGPNLRRSPNARFRAFAHDAIGAGVDVVHGHSSHVAQGVERHGDGIVLYDTGNFIDDYWKIPFRRTTSTFIWLLDVRPGTRPGLKVVPVVTKPHPLRLATGARRREMIDHMRGLCSNLGTTTVESDDGLVVL